MKTSPVDKKILINSHCKALHPTWTVLLCLSMSFLTPLGNLCLFTFGTSQFIQLLKVILGLHRIKHYIKSLPLKYLFSVSNLRPSLVDLPLFDMFLLSHLTPSNSSHRSPYSWEINFFLVINFYAEKMQMEWKECTRNLIHRKENKQHDGKWINFILTMFFSRFKKNVSLRGLLIHKIGI